MTCATKNASVGEYLFLYTTRSYASGSTCPTVSPIKRPMLPRNHEQSSPCRTSIPHDTHSNQGFLSSSLLHLTGLQQSATLVCRTHVAFQGWLTATWSPPRYDVRTPTTTPVHDPRVVDSLTPMSIYKMSSRGNGTSSSSSSSCIARPRPTYCRTAASVILIGSTVSLHTISHRSSGGGRC